MTFSIYFFKNFCHDSDKHVHECDLKQESPNDEENPQNSIAHTTPYTEVLKVKFTKGEQIRMHDCIQNIVIEGL